MKDFVALHNLFILLANFSGSEHGPGIENRLHLFFAVYRVGNSINKLPTILFWMHARQAPDLVCGRAAGIYEHCKIATIANTDSD
jgi:hypothetical protein